MPRAADFPRVICNNAGMKRPENSIDEDLRDEDPWCCNGNMEECVLCTESNPHYPWICPGHTKSFKNRIMVTLNGNW